MWPEYIIVDHFVYRDYRVSELTRIQLWCEPTDNTDNTHRYAYFKRNNHDLLGQIFVHRNTAYKIEALEDKKIAVLINKHIMRTYFILSVYTDAHIIDLQNKVKHLKEQLLVFSDSVEEQGGIRLANTLREQANKIMLEDLV